MAHDNQYEIIVNGTQHTVETEVMTFKALVAIAYPGQTEEANVIFSITFEHADQKPENGTLAAGGSVKIKKHGTIFDVVRTIRS